MSQVTAVLSMLHEGPDLHSGTRTFRSEPVIRWTLDRLNRSGALNEIAILCWEDQLDALEGIAEEADAHILAKGPRMCVPEVESIAAARRWGDGWRGGLHGSTEFDQGFYGPWIQEIAERLPSDVLVLVNPAAALIDPCLIDELVTRAVDREDLEMCFLPAAPGFAAATIRPVLLDRLAAARQHPGRMLSYQPDHPMRDAISMDSCVPVPTPVARTTRRFTLDSDRQVSMLLDSCESLNGTLITSEAETILRTVSKTAAPDDMPREVTLELSTRRLSRPIDSPVTYHAIRRRLMLPDVMRKLLTELGRCDDLRLTIGGVGDPLCADNVIEVIEAAKVAGVTAINVETDLLNADDTLIRRLVEAKPDVVSVIVPAVTQKTYMDVMGVDGLSRVIANVKTLLLYRQKLQAGVPLVAPVFTKTSGNLAEMEAWFDQWLRAVGSAVLRGPSDYAGQIPYHGVADMSPPCRKACARLNSRLTVLCNGSVVACEQDFQGQSPLGNVEASSIGEIWQTKFAAMRDDHASDNFMKHPLCGACREWHRP